MNFLGGRKPVQEPPRQPPPQQSPNNPYGRLSPRNPNGYGADPYGQAQQAYTSQDRRGYDPPQEKHAYSRTHPGVSSGMAPTILINAESTKPEFQYTNTVPVSPFDFPREQFNPNGFYLLLNGTFVVTARQDDGYPQGKIGLSKFHREWLQSGLTEQIEVRMYDIFEEGGRNHFLGSLDVEIGFAAKRVTDQPLDQEELQAAFTRKFENQILSPGERILMDWKSIPLLIVVKGIQLVDLSVQKGADAQPNSSDPRARGILTKQSQMTFFKNAKSSINLKASKKRAAGNAVLTPDFKFEDMGIGGLDKEFTAIFRRAFASRIFPPGLIEAMGIQHVKGILLFGPPGTGKTLIARRIGKMLNAREPKVINGPEVLNKFVGQSEENIRKLFADAEKEYKEKGDESGLHIIIFDELDAVCKQRGSGAGGGTGVGDSVVNQLLAKLDGVDQLNNILLIGMTNRMDMIDDALLRPGRLEVHMEISLPNDDGRVQILKIHTAKMRESGNLDPNVNLLEYGEKWTKNFSGAEISGLVRSATSFALQRHVKVGTMAGVSDDVDHLTVSKVDFDNALKEVKPAFGASEDTLESYIRGGIFKKEVQEGEMKDSTGHILDAGYLIIKQVNDPDSSPRFRALLWGAPGCGKTALAAQLAMDSKFPYIKIITPDDMIGFSEAMKKDHMKRIFDDAYKSPLSCIILDNIESIIEWVRIGPRFSNPVLQAMKAMLNKQPPKGHRLLVLATATDRTVMQELGLYQSFDQKIAVPPVNTEEELKLVMRASKAFDEGVIAAALQELRSIINSNTIGVGIKSVLLAIDTAKQDANPAERFAEIIAGMKAESEYV